MEFIPAIDLIDGQCVRLVQGDFARQITYGDPITAAQEIEEQGASWLHLVDLDGARSKSGPNRGIIKRICKMVGLKIEVGGGIRSSQDALELLDAGVERVIVGTMVMTRPEIISEIVQLRKASVAVGLDYRWVGSKREVAVNGWLEGSGKDIFEVLPGLIDCGATALVATDISRDGTFDGPDLETLEMLVEIGSGTGLQVIASGGVSGISDLLRLKSIESNGFGLFGAISGRAIHDGRLSVREAVELCRT